MTTAELSAETGVSPAAIRKLAKVLGGRRDGRSYIFPPNAARQLQNLLKEAGGKEKPGTKTAGRKKGAPGWRTVRIRFQKKKADALPQIRLGRKHPK